MHSTREYNFDGLVGPSHNYAGLSFGNVASFSNVKSASNPKQAALQGLAKMRALAARGFAQALLPPQDRPNFRLLRAIGFTGHGRRSAGACLQGVARDPGLRVFRLAHVDGERRHGQPFGGHAGRPRAFHGRQPE